MEFDDKPLPKKIEPCPIHQAFFEIRFASDVESEIPGLIFGAIRDRYQILPPPTVAQIPQEIRNRDPSLRFLPTHSYGSDDYLLGLGPRVVNLATVPRRYPGWHAFLPQIAFITEVLRNQGIVREVERIGLRYINFFESTDIWANTTMDVSQPGTNLDSGDLHVRRVMHHHGLECLVQISRPAYVTETERRAEGSLIDIDVSAIEVPWDASEAVACMIEEMHTLEKHQFFGLLAPQFLEKMNPSY
ncbi:MAG: TIGR04255 family protein [Verrucomicrobia bacterium]|nr:TIGR04255 family protein [Verrucomicrobiota bacterium]